VSFLSEVSGRRNLTCKNSEKESKFKKYFSNIFNVADTILGYSDLDSRVPASWEVYLIITIRNNQISRYLVNIG
jgi:hypothetical protein